MQEVVFATEAEANAQQAIDYAAHMAAHSDNSKYTAETVRWAVPVQRLDGKWAYLVCPHSDYSGLTVEDYSPENYPAE